MELICECGQRHIFGTSIGCVQCSCGSVVYGDCSRPVRAEAVDDAIPLWVKLIAKIRIDADSGIGDTVQRVAAKLGGERFKQLVTAFGMECGCTERQADWNARWPY